MKSNSGHKLRWRIGFFYKVVDWFEEYSTTILDFRLRPETFLNSIERQKQVTRWRRDGCEIQPRVSHVHQIKHHQ